MQLFGLTGGIGMGKTTCAGFLRQCGVPVIDTDDLARDLVQPGQPALREIAGAFGDSFIESGGELSRAALAELVFSDVSARRRLEAILHPRIQEKWIALVEEIRRANHPLAVVVIPLLFETGAENLFDTTVCLACSPATQQTRLLERGWSVEQIHQRLAAQLPVEQKMARAGRVIWTEGSLSAHAGQAWKVFGLAEGPVRKM